MDDYMKRHNERVEEIEKRLKREARAWNHYEHRLRRTSITWAVVFVGIELPTGNEGLAFIVATVSAIVVYRMLLESKRISND